MGIIWVRRRLLLGVDDKGVSKKVEGSCRDCAIGAMVDNDND